MKVLLIEGESHYSSWLTEKLVKAGFRFDLSEPTDLAFRSETARQAVATIVDVGCSGHSPCQIVRRAREVGHKAPILVISEKESWREKVESLDAGADDFLVKPVRSEEISARLRALVRRSAGQTHDRFACGKLEMDMKFHCVWMDGECLDLTRNEFRLLRQLLLWPDRIHTHLDIQELIQQPGTCNSPNAVEVLVARTRRKVGRDTIRTVRGIGYRLDNNSRRDAA